MHAPEVIAAVDIGSNSAHLLVALVDDRTVTPLADESALLGLGGIVDRDGRLPFAARTALVEALDGFATTARRWHANELLLLGAEPFRRATDADEVSEMVLGRIGVPIVVLDHADEAELTLLGVTRGTPVEAPLLVVDIGGGSTEAIVQAPGVAPRTFIIASGSNRLTQACDPADPPMPADREQLAMRARELLAGRAGSPPVTRGLRRWQRHEPGPRRDRRPGRRSGGARHQPAPRRRRAGHPRDRPNAERPSWPSAIG